MEGIFRGQIYYAQLGQQESHVQGRFRPVVIVSNNVGNMNSGIVLVVPITSKEKRPLPTHFDIELPNVHGTVLCEQITCISKENLVNYCGVLTRQYIGLLNQALSNSLDLEGKFSAGVSDLHDIEVKEQIKKIEELQKTYIEQVALLGKMVGFYQSQQKETKELLPKTAPQPKQVEARKYRKRSLDEIRAFIKEWEAGNRSDELLEEYGFSTRQTASLFYSRHKED